jgi:hypothetical protein
MSLCNDMPVSRPRDAWRRSPSHPTGMLAATACAPVPSTQLPHFLAFFMFQRWLGALGCALVLTSAFAASGADPGVGPATPPSVPSDSASGQVQLAASADCQTTANVLWSFTYTQNPAREFGRITIPSGTVIGSYDQASPLTGGTFSGTWTQPITLPQPPNTLIGSYGGAGDNPATAAHTAEFFVLYNCTTRQTLYTCSGSLGTCPTTAIQALARLSQPVPATSSGALAAMLLAVLGTAAYALRGRLAPQR